jgi:hypothetical protein
MMNHIALEEQPDAVQRFFRELAIEPQGSVLEMNGRPVARILPALSSPDSNETWTTEMNTRRCDLIDRKHDRGLDPEEAAELESLQQAMRRFVRRMAPLPLQAARLLHQSLLEKAAASGS